VAILMYNRFAVEVGLDKRGVMAPGEELADLVRDFAAELAGALPDPAGRGIRLNLLLEGLERQAAESGQPIERLEGSKMDEKGNQRKIGHPA